MRSSIECEKKLRPFGASLTKAVEFFIRHTGKSKGSKSFADVCDQFLSSRRAMSCRPRTIVQYQSHISVLSKELGALQVAAIKASDLEVWLEEHEVEPGPGREGGPISPRTRRNYLTTLSTIFNYAVGKDYLALNPAAKIPKPKLDEKPIGILNPLEAARLLTVARLEMPEMVPGIAIGLFAGLRRSEIGGLEWRSVNLPEKCIIVEGMVSKTRQRRVVRVTENLAEWLTPYTKPDGPVAFHPDVFGEKLRELVRAKADPSGAVSREAVVEVWPHNALRHSFGSYYYAQSKNETSTAAEMGNSPDIVHKHYRALVREAAATEFWNIRP